MGINTNMAKMTKAQVDRVVKAVQTHYFSENPPPKLVQVETKTVRPDKIDVGYFCAKATIEVDTAQGTKKHSVHIRFRIDAKDRLVGQSIGYL